MKYRFVRYWFRFLSRPRINTDILVNILFISKTSSRRLQDMLLRRLQNMSSRRLQDVFRVTIFRLSRRLEDVLKMSWKTKNCYAGDVLKTSSRHVLSTSSRRLEDQQMFAGVTSTQQKQPISLFSSTLHLKHLHQVVFPRSCFMTQWLRHSSSLFSKRCSSLSSVSATDVVASFSGLNWWGFKHFFIS